jgi:hypothetical protein
MKAGEPLRLGGRAARKLIKKPKDPQTTLMHKCVVVGKYVA